MTAKSIISESYKPLTIFATEDTFSQNNEQTISQKPQHRPRG